MRGADLPDCDREVIESGRHLATIVLSDPYVIENLVKGAAKNSGQRIDWYFVSTGAAVRFIGNADLARKALEEELKPYGSDCYRFST